MLVTRLEKGIRLITENEEAIKELEELQPFEKMVNRALEIDKEIEDVGLSKFIRYSEQIITFGFSEKSQQKHIEELEHTFHDNMEVCPLCETVLK